LDLGPIEGPLLLFGGPYSNLQATQAMRRETERIGIPPSRVICTGDIVAYCAEPDAVVREIRDWGVTVVMGNCEESLATDSPDCGCGFEDGTACSLLSDSWYRFSTQNTGDGHRNWMGELPRSVRFNLADHTFLVVHGAPSSINRFIFESTPAAEKTRELKRADTDVVIGGHCGIPFGQRVGEKFWLNSGAIGMPANDGSRDGWYLLLNPIDGGIRAGWQRLRYDWHRAQLAMRQAGLANGYADTLGTGLWPSMDVLPDDERSRQGKALDPMPLMLPAGKGPGIDSGDLRNGT